MKILLVTSQITYMPENYANLFVELSKLNLNIEGVVFLKNFQGDMFKSSFGLIAIGAKKIGKSLLKNIFTFKFQKREKIVKNDMKAAVLHWKTMNSKTAYDYVKDNNIDLIINIRTRCIYKEKILNAPRLGCVNIHHGLLPKYRGTMCDLYALNENRDAGFSIHKMEKKIDRGRILKVIKVSKNDHDYFNYLSKTPKKEALALKELIDEVRKNNKLPEGHENKSAEVIFTKNPTPQVIKEFIKKGMIL